MSDVQIPAVLLSFVIAWFMRAINVLKTKGQDLTVDKMEELLTDTLGNSITFGMLKGLDGNDLVEELRAIGVTVPRTAAKVFTAFVQAWNVATPRCDNTNCQMLGININPSKNGVESIVEGTRCSWCEGRGIVRSTKVSLTFMAWTTGLQVPNGTEADTQSSIGSRILLLEKDLRPLTDAAILTALDAEGVLVRDWLRYLLAGPENEYGIPRKILPVYSSLDSRSVTQFGPQVLARHVLMAKRYAEGEGKRVEREEEVPAREIPRSVGTPQGLNRVLADLFPTSRQAMMVIEDAGLPVSRFPFGDGLSAATMWFGLIGEARKHGAYAVVQIALVAAKRYPGNNALRVSLHDFLSKLLPAEFETSLMYLDVPRGYISPAGAPQATRATEVIQYLVTQQ